MTQIAQLPDTETVNRLVQQGKFLLKAFHEEYAKDRTGRDTEFYRGNITGWRLTLQAFFPDFAEQVIDRARSESGLAIPHSGQLAKDGSGYLGFDSGADF